jgi:lipoprotein-releasing system ATP-binding protein
MRIRTENVTKSYQDADHALTVLDNVTLDFPERGSVAIVGRSGIGKSTLLHLLGGLDTVTSGRIWYDDTPLDALSGDALSAFRGKHIGFIFQFHHLLPEFSALENVAMPLLIEGLSEAEAMERGAAMLRRVALHDRLHHRPGALSGGEQQRVAIARALVTNPAVILADEPTGNLDVATAGAVQELLLTMNRELGNLLVVVTHSQELAQSMDRIAEMEPGGRLNFR